MHRSAQKRFKTLDVLKHICDIFQAKQSPTSQTSTDSTDQINACKFLFYFTLLEIEEKHKFSVEQMLAIAWRQV